MKPFGSIMDFTHRRNSEIISIFRRLVANSNHIVMSDILRVIANSPASRFWVSESRAAVVIARMLAGKPLIKMRSNKKEMFTEIYRRFLNLRQSDPDISILDGVAIIVNSPAPRMFLTPRTIGEIIYHIKKNPHNGKR